MEVEAQAQNSAPEASEERLVHSDSDLQNGVNTNIIDAAECDPPSGDGDFEVQGADEASRLKALAADVRDQDDLERDIGRQKAVLNLVEGRSAAFRAGYRTRTKAAGEDSIREGPLLTNERQSKLLSQIRKLRARLSRPMGTATTSRITAEIAHLEALIVSLDKDLEQIRERMEDRDRAEKTSNEAAASLATRRLPGESQRDFLIRTGKITPFSKLPGRSLPRSDSTLQDVLLDAEEGELDEESAVEKQIQEERYPDLSHRNLIQPGFVDDETSETVSDAQSVPGRHSKRRNLHDRPTRKRKRKRSEPHQRDDATASDQGGISSGDEVDRSFVLEIDDREHAASPESDDVSGRESDEGWILNTTPPRRKTGAKRGLKSDGQPWQHEDLSRIDDGNEALYQARLQAWVNRRTAARKKVRSAGSMNQRPAPKGSDAMEDVKTEENAEALEDIETQLDEWHMPHPVRPDTELEGGYRIPGDIYPSLFNYQKTGVQWLWELYSQQVGGIVGDEMGLGKTIQIIAFLAGLHYSKKLSRPVIVVAPATVMKQWVNEFHTWWPPFRVSILHTSGSGMIDVGREVAMEEELLVQVPTARRRPKTKNQKAAKRIVNRVINEGHVLVTTYTGLQTYADLLIPVNWEYAVLDEGHKIRNPNTAITIYCKELKTANRVILSGTPMQNNLVELWSLFDFIFPMRLGTLVNFRGQFEIPIRQGGYANASNLQVQTAMKCAETLKDTISPYLLQRFKADVASDLPKKTEQVLFCKLTRSQREAYEYFLGSDELKAIMNGRRQVLYGVDILRKICNHPDLQDHRTLSIKPGYNYGSGAKSGKMQVVKALLELWKDQGHKTLLFAQHRIMLDILEKFVRSLPGFNLRRLDGNTPIHTRQGLVDEFNSNPNAHVFLLTTKVGGLGINLTGADRVIIYDPDWNPSTDVQARERAWRLGQKREVMIYRLMIAGTIEEKIYHRQLFKQFLTNKILRDPKQRQTFQMQDLHDLFTLGNANEPATETSAMFKGTEVKFSDSDAQPPAPPASHGALSVQPILGPNGTSNESSSIRQMDGVAAMEQFNVDDDEAEQLPDSNDATNSEARVMEGIFARAGVHSALEHDQIVNGKRVIAADPKIIEKEAKKVAAEAAKELRKAGEVARNVPVGTPTWTGQFGVAGRPEEQLPPRGFGRTRGGPPSSSILAGLQSRQLANGAASSPELTFPTTGGPRHGIPVPRGVDLMKMIRDYIIAHGGKVYTQMLIDHFNRFCTTQETTMQFREMLKETARLEKGSRGRGSWVLKDDLAQILKKEISWRSSARLKLTPEASPVKPSAHHAYTSPGPHPSRTPFPHSPFIGLAMAAIIRQLGRIDPQKAGFKVQYKTMSRLRGHSDNQPTQTESPEAKPTQTGKSAPKTADGTPEVTGSPTATTGEGKKNKGKETKAAKTGSAKTTKEAASKSVDQRLPPGGVNLITPSALAQTTYYKVGDYVEFAWNYTSLSIKPSMID
ncbi:MAG: hypothetical protein Q9214_000796, partial [Letrouitia sp. 1 TL-2023]